MIHSSYFSSSLDTPFGTMTFIGTTASIVWASVPGGDGIDAGRRWLSKHASYQGDIPDATGIPLFSRLKKQMKEYFENKRTRFDIPMILSGTPFYKTVWHQLEQIPYGQTYSYKKVACRLGKPTAARAVGSACRSNPVPVIIPCHRVIGSNGQLTGYAGHDGTETKKQLLALERGER